MMDGLQAREAKSGTTWGKTAWFFAFLFLAGNCSAGLGVLVTSSSLPILFAGLAGVGLAMASLFRPAWIKGVLFCFALTFPLYGSHPYSSHSFLFELFVSFLSLMLLLQAGRVGSHCTGNRLTALLLFAYAALACGSLLLLPVRNMAWQLLLWDWSVFWNRLFFATPALPLYSVAAVNRLLLYILCIVLLSSFCKARQLYQILFMGLLAAAGWSSVLGIADHFSLIDLDWFRRVQGRGLRLQSVFANPGWFAEFVVVVIPFVLPTFLAMKKNLVNRIGLFGGLVVGEVAIILTYSRTGWILYPLVLLGCWFFVHIANRENRGRFSLFQIDGRLFIGVILLLAIVSSTYLLIFQTLDSERVEGISERSMFAERVQGILNPNIRKEIWLQSLDMIREKPLFGMGYESFKFHNTILQKIKQTWDTPHNFYVQQLISGGVAGLMIWVLLIFATLYLLVADLTENRRYGNIAVIGSIVAFHLYGLTQAMQYIPMIWFLVFLNIGYALSLGGEGLTGWNRRRHKIALRVLCAVGLLGIVVYGSDFESRKLAAGQGLDIYALDQEQPRYLGFHGIEHWQGQGVFRWTGSSAIIKLPAAELFRLTFVCGAPDLDRKPLHVSIHADNRLLDTLLFSRPESILREYYLPRAVRGGSELFIRVSRTWNQKQLGVAEDSRDLGVAVSEVGVMAKIPPAGIGFYPWERWRNGPLPGKQEPQFEYRWTRGRAVFLPGRLERPKELYFRAGQPGLPGKPLRVRVLQNGALIREFLLADTDWHRISLETLNDLSAPCIVEVARTWNAKQMGVGKDTRTLGVAVTGLRNVP